MSKYSGMANTATKMINTSGRNILIKRVVAGTFNPLTNSIAGATSSETTVKAVVTKYKYHEIDGQVIKASDKKILLSAGTDIRVGDKMIDDGEYHIVDIEEVNPGTQAVLLKAQARK